MIPVRTVTVNATHDDLSEQDYRDIYDELRQQHSLRAFVEMTGSGASIAQWSRYERGEWSLTRQAKRDLRRAVGLVALPLTVVEAMADVDPDAEVIEIGDGEAVRRVLKLRNDTPLSIYVNGMVTAQEGACTGRTRSHRTRREMSAEQARVWDGLSAEERNRVLGIHSV